MYTLWTDFETVYYEINGWWYDGELELQPVPPSVGNFGLAQMAVIDHEYIENISSEPLFIGAGEDAALLMTEAEPNFSLEILDAVGDTSIDEMIITSVGIIGIPDINIPYQDGQRNLPRLNLPPFDPALLAEFQDEDGQNSTIALNEFLSRAYHSVDYITLVERIPGRGTGVDGYFVVNKSHFYDLNMNPISDEDIIAQNPTDTNTVYDAYISNFEQIWEYTGDPSPLIFLITTDGDHIFLAKVSSSLYRIIHGRHTLNTLLDARIDVARLLLVPNPETRQLFAASPPREFILFEELGENRQPVRSNLELVGLLNPGPGPTRPRPAATIGGAGDIWVPAYNPFSVNEPFAYVPTIKDFHKESFEEHLRHLYGLPSVAPPFELISFEKAGILLESGTVTFWSMPPLLQPWSGPLGTPNRIVELDTFSGIYRVKAQVVGNQITAPV